VLLVEDDPDAREVTAAGLTKAGFEVHAVSGAVKALELLDIWLPDVVVSDIGMPGMDGYEFVKLLRARPPERGGKVAALALTAFAGLPMRACACERYQEHLAKPINPEALAEAILLCNGGTAAECPVPISRSSTQGVCWVPSSAAPPCMTSPGCR